MALDNTKQFVLFPNGQIMGGLMYIETAPDTYVPWDGTVEISFGATSLALNDGVDNDIKATVVDYLGSAGEANPLAVVLVNTDGNLYNASGGGGGGAVTIADGADVNAGDTTDAAVTGDNTGTLSAKLRGINKILANVWDSVNSRLNVFIQNTTLAVTQSGSWVISAGSAIIGSVTINRTTPGTTNTVAPIAGQDGVAGGTGTDSATTQRVSLATDIPLPAGTNNIGDVDVLSIIPGTGATNLGKAEDSAHTSGDVGVMSLAVSNVAQATFSADGDYTPIATDLKGNVMVVGNVANNASDSGNPVKIGAVGIGPGSSGQINIAGYRANLTTDLNGRLAVNTQSLQTVRVHLDGSSAYTDQALFPDPGDGFRNVMTFFQISTGAATALNVFIEEGSTKVWGPVYLEAVAGRGYVSGPINIPFTASTAQTVTTSASIAQSIDATYFVQALSV